jgi:hypothetical protein
VLQHIKIIHVLNEGNPRDSIWGPRWTRLGKGIAWTCTDEARIQQRDRTGNDVDRAALDASLRFRRGLGAKSSYKVKETQRIRAPRNIEIETHWVKGRVRHPVRLYKLRLGYLGRKANPLPRLTDDRAGVGRRQRSEHVSQI